MRQLNSLFLCSFLLLAGTAFAQQTETFDPAKDVRKTRGYTIQLTPASYNTFGFTVLKDNKAVWSQLSNPFGGMSFKGFTTKKDAYTLAEWIIGEQEKDNRKPLVFTAQLALQLHITTSQKQPQ